VGRLARVLFDPATPDPAPPTTFKWARLSRSQCCSHRGRTGSVVLAGSRRRCWRCHGIRPSLSRPTCFRGSRLPTSSKLHSASAPRCCDTRWLSLRVLSAVPPLRTRSGFEPADPRFVGRYARARAAGPRACLKRIRAADPQDPGRQRSLVAHVRREGPGSDGALALGQQRLRCAPRSSKRSPSPSGHRGDRAASSQRLGLSGLVVAANLIAWNLVRLLKIILEY
jgi:hypothetical protein